MRIIYYTIILFLVNCSSDESNKTIFSDPSEYYKNTLNRTGRYTLDDGNYGYHFPILSESYLNGNVTGRNTYFSSFETDVQWDHSMRQEPLRTVWFYKMNEKEKELWMKSMKSDNPDFFDGYLGKSFYSDKLKKKEILYYKGGKIKSIEEFNRDGSQKSLTLMTKDGKYKTNGYGNLNLRNWPSNDFYSCRKDNKNTNHSWDEFRDSYGNLTWRCRGVDNGQFVDYCNCENYIKDDTRWPEK